MWEGIPDVCVLVCDVVSDGWCISFGVFGVWNVEVVVEGVSCLVMVDG